MRTQQKLSLAALKLPVSVSTFSRLESGIANLEKNEDLLDMALVKLGHISRKEDDFEELSLRFIGDDSFLNYCPPSYDFTLQSTDPVSIKIMNVLILLYEKDYAESQIIMGQLKDNVIEMTDVQFIRFVFCYLQYCYVKGKYSLIYKLGLGMKVDLKDYTEIFIRFTFILSAIKFGFPLPILEFDVLCDSLKKLSKGHLSDYLKARLYESIVLSGIYHHYKMIDHVCYATTLELKNYMINAIAIGTYMFDEKMVLNKYMTEDNFMLVIKHFFLIRDYERIRVLSEKYPRYSFNLNIEIISEYYTNRATLSPKKMISFYLKDSNAIDKMSDFWYRLSLKEDFERFTNINFKI